MLDCALRLRLGDAIIEPKKSKLLKFRANIDWYSKVKTQIDETVVTEDYPDSLPSIAKKVLIKTISKEFATLFRTLMLKHTYVHIDFIEDLTSEVKRYRKSKKRLVPMAGLCNTDIQHIIDAWDNRYIKRREHMGKLKPMK